MWKVALQVCGVGVYMQIAKSQISLRIHAVWSGLAFSAYSIIGYCIIVRCIAQTRIRLCGFTTLHLAVRICLCIYIFLSRGTDVPFDINLPPNTIKPLTCWTRICHAFANSEDPDQLASEEASWSGSALFAIKYVNLYQQSGSNNPIGWKLEVGAAS